MAEMRYDHLISALEQYGAELVAKYRERLSAAGKNASSRLHDTVEAYVEQKEDAVTLWLALQDYWKYLERGTRMQGPYRQQGRRPPLKPFVEWVQQKGLPLRGKKVEQVAWAVATSVWKHGTRPFWFLKESLAELPDIDARVEEALREDINTYIEEIIAEI